MISLQESPRCIPWDSIPEERKLSHRNDRQLFKPCSENSAQSSDLNPRILLGPPPTDTTAVMTPISKLGLLVKAVWGSKAFWSLKHGTLETLHFQTCLPVSCSVTSLCKTPITTFPLACQPSSLPLHGMCSFWDFQPNSITMYGAGLCREAPVQLLLGFNLWVDP